MYRLTIIVGRLYKSAPPTNYFFKVPLVGRFVPLVGGIGRPMESPIQGMVINPLWSTVFTCYDIYQVGALALMHTFEAVICHKRLLIRENPAI